MEHTCIDCGKRVGPTSIRCRACAPKANAADRAAQMRGRPKSAAHRAKLAEVNLRKGEESRQRTWEEFYRPGPPDQCWEWQGTRLHGQGYGRVGRGGRAHVLSWEMANGQKVPDGMLVLHRCDNPPCVNPAHLYIGTHADNARDRKLRDRGVKGRRVNTNKLTEEDVYAIRGACDSGERQADIARRFGVTQPMVGFIARRESWAWLPEKPT